MGGRARSCGDGAVVVAAVGGHDGAAEGQRDAALPGELGGVGDPVPQAERPVVVAVGLGGRAEALGLAARLGGGGQRSGEVVAGQVVVGELGGGGEQAGEVGVQAGALARQQVGVDDLLEEGVAEGVAAAPDAQQPARDDLAHRLLEVGQRQAGDLAQELVLDAAAGHGGGAQHLLGGARTAPRPGTCSRLASPSGRVSPSATAANSSSA